MRNGKLAGKVAVVTGASKGIGAAIAKRLAAEGAAVVVNYASSRGGVPIGRVVGPADVAALAVHLMTNTALTGATYDIDGGQQLVEA